MQNRGKLHISNQEISKKRKPSVSRLSLDAWFKINFPRLNPVPIVHQAVVLFFQPLDTIADLYLRFRGKR